jgi:hypothetical protein
MSVKSFIKISVISVLKFCTFTSFLTDHPIHSDWLCTVVRNVTINQVCPNNERVISGAFMAAKVDKIFLA